MISNITFEHYSTFAPVTGAFLADDPEKLPQSAFSLSRPLSIIDKGYYYSSSTSAISKHKFNKN